MLKVTILLPLADNYGMLFEETRFNGILDRLLEIAGGFTSDGQTTGGYTMDNFQVARDTCDRFFVMVERDKLDLLRDLASYAARELSQESIYLEYHETNVEFVRG